MYRAAQHGDKKARGFLAEVAARDVAEGHPVEVPS
jgi:hypothetical protein